MFPNIPSFCLNVMNFRLIKFMKTKRYFLFLLLGLLIAFFPGCSTSPRRQKPSAPSVDNNGKPFRHDVRYASGFQIYREDGLIKIIVYNPGDPQRVQSTFYILPKNEEKDSGDASHVFHDIPRNAAVFSATQLNAFDQLGILDKVVGISESAYVRNAYIRQRVETGSIAELAGNGNFFFEKTLRVNPAVIFYTPYSVNDMHSMETTQIPLVPFFDYLETDPLGRAEWIKFTAAFFGKLDKADSIFSRKVKEYNDYKQLVEDVSVRPTVFSDKYFNGQWYVPGGRSYVARLFADAGADYLWKGDRHTGSFPLEYEVVYEKAHDADFWRIVGSYGEKPSYQALAVENELYSHFKAFTTHHVVYCDARKTAYFETSPLNPQFVLADLIKAFHPDVLPDYKPKYYHVLR